MSRKKTGPSSSSPKDTLEVSQYDCDTRFLVTSESRPNEVHLVDLDGERGAECSCEDWEYRNKDWVLGPWRYTCKHIKAVRKKIDGFA